MEIIFGYMQPVIWLNQLKDLFHLIKSYPNQSSLQLEKNYLLEIFPHSRLE